MKKVKVKMIVEFMVPTDPDFYKGRNDGDVQHWKRYAEHDMQKFLKDWDEFGDASYVHVFDQNKITFEWTKEIENVED